MVCHTITTHPFWEHCVVGCNAMSTTRLRWKHCPTRWTPILGHTLLELLHGVVIATECSFERFGALQIFECMLEGSSPHCAAGSSIPTFVGNHACKSHHTR